MILSLKASCFAALQDIYSARRDTAARSGLGWNRNELSHAHQVISRCREGENPSDIEQSAMFHFAQQRDIFQPAEALLNPLSLLLTDVVTGMPCGARIDGAAATSAVVLRHVRGYVHVAALLDELRRVKSLVAADRDATVAGDLLQHQKRRIALGPPVGLEQLRIHDQTV